MSDRPSRGGREAEPPAESPAESPEVDDEVQRRLREAYLNDAERELIVTGVRSADETVVVEFRTHTATRPTPSGSPPRGTAR